VHPRAAHHGVRRAKLGLEKRADFPYREGSRWIEVAPPGAANAIALVSPSEGFLIVESRG
jgi:hypothetical protein